MIAAAPARMQIRPLRSPRRCRRGAVSGGATDRIDGLVHRLACRSDQPFCFELGKGLAVLLPAPINHVALVNDGRWPEKLVQALLDQRIFAAFLLGDRTIWRGWGGGPPPGAGVVGGGRGSPPPPPAAPWKEA